MAKKNKSAFKQKQKIILWISLCLATIIVIVVAIDIYNRQQKKKIIEEKRISQEEIDLISEPRVIVPDPDTQLSEEERQIIAIPDRAASANPASGTLSQNRSFNFQLENNNLINTSGSGKEINIYLHDNISLTFMSLDKEYDIYMPDYFGTAIIVKAGETVRRRFQAVELGSSVYYCGVCGGPDSEASGQIVVHER